MTTQVLTPTSSIPRSTLLHPSVLRIHGVMLLIVALAAANATVARYLGIGPYAFLQQNPMAWVGLIQAYLLMAVVALTLLIGVRQSQPHTWHLIGAAAHLAPLLAVIFSWTLLTSLGFGAIASGSLAFHAIWIVIETIMVFVPAQT